MSNVSNVQMEEGWKNALQKEFSKPYFAAIKSQLVEEKKVGKIIYPPGSLIFNAFNSTPFDKLKVVILGQDPYHGPNQAMGLCFSVPKGVAVPPSLQNIYRELKEDVDLNVPNHGDLTKWTHQGVFLLNAGLTVQARQANSHKNIGWHTFTDAVIKIISEQKEGIVFLLWGGFAKKKSKLIDTLQHHVLTSGHPSPLSANKGHWFGNKHFSKTNELLNQQGKTPIDWQV